MPVDVCHRDGIGEGARPAAYTSPRVVIATNPSVSIISIRPPYAGAVLSGEKTAELRTKKPRFLPGDLLVVYETAPTMAIRGVVEVREIVVGTPAFVRRRHLAAAQVSRDQFDAYFAGRDYAVAILLGGVCEFENPLSLAALRRDAPSFNPPQTWVSVSTLPLPVQRLLQQELREWC